MKPYQMTEMGDSNHVDYVTRQRMKIDEDRISFWGVILIALVIFMFGVFVGNVIHDTSFHPIEIRK